MTKQYSKTVDYEKKLKMATVHKIQGKFRGIQI